MHALILAQTCHCEIAPWLISKKIEIYFHEYELEDVQNLRGQLNEVLDEIVGD
ncbi:MAG: hypothetical protein KC484_10950 [Colwelliaceae bacterium]|nr:hypothetical protein [Colwelliaceae bacterium]